MMNFRRFTLYNPSSEQLVSVDEEVLLINLDHIVSVKPINIATKNEVLKAYWIRLTNGKKYKAISLPAELDELIDAQDFVQVSISEEVTANELQ